MRLRAGLLVVGVVIASTLVPARAGWAVVGGAPVSVQAAPWSVLVSEDSSYGVQLCGGSIIDAVHVLTAAHCVFDPTGALSPPAAIGVRAGISNVGSPAAADAEQDRAVASVDVYPGYVWTGGASANDVAVITLSQPLVLAGGAAQAVVLPPPGAFPAGVPAAVTGFGRESAAAPPDGSLRQASFTVEPQATCAAVVAALLAGSTSSLCASSPDSAICHGDSGSGLVTGQSTIVGVVSAGPEACAPGSDGVFTWVGATAITAFIRSVAPVVPAAAAPAAARSVASALSRKRAGSAAARAPRRAKAARANAGP